MKKFLSLLVMFLFVLGVTMVMAEPVTVASVDIEKVFNGYDGTKKAKTKLEEKLGKEKKRLEEKKKELQKLADTYDKQKTTMSKDEKKNMEEELQTKLTKLQADTQETTQAIAQEEKDMTANIVEEIRAIIQKVAKDKKYDLVFEKSALISGGEDITFLVIKKINEQ
ncbi:MAG: OmpH family outer membrane protein [bacterium]